MFFFRRPPAGAPPKSESTAGTVPAGVILGAAPVSGLTLEQHAEQMVARIRAYAKDKIGVAHAKLGAALLLRIARDIEVVQLKGGRETLLPHPAFESPTTFENERGRKFSFHQVAVEAYSRCELTNFAIFPEEHGLVAKSPSGRWQVAVSELVPDPWYSALVAMGQKAKSSAGLDRYSYQAKVHLLGGGESRSADGARTMTHRHRLRRQEMRLFKGCPEMWAELDAVGVRRSA